MSRRLRILIVEDDDALRQMYRVALSFAGMVGYEAANGLEALQRIETDPPDAVILDLDLPMVSGVAVRRELAAHAATRNIPIVIVTGSAEGLDSLDVACILRKPVSPDRLVEAVRKCLASGAGLAR